MNQKNIVIKVGTNVLSQNFKLDISVLESIVSQIRKLHAKGANVVLVTSGAVAAGKEVKNFGKENSGLLQKQMLAAIGQARLMNIYEKLFAKFGIVIGQALLERDDFAHRNKYLNLRSALEGLLSNKIVPIINENDVIATEELRFSDNDQLAALVACALSADSLIICTDMDGFFTSDPRKNKKAELIKEISAVTPEISEMAGKSSSSVGLGGMMSKISSAKVAAEQGIEVYICNGRRAGNILAVFNGKNPGTHIAAQNKKNRRLKNWALTSAIAEGAVTVDEGAAAALLKRKSLLLVGVKALSGSFSTGTPIVIKDKLGHNVGVGISNFSAEEISEFLADKNKKSAKELVHANKLFLYEENS